MFLALEATEYEPASGEACECIGMLLRDAHILVIARKISGMNKNSLNE
jgi:hypothetical protein